MDERTELDLSECDEEPIHLIGSIRPSGCLIGVHRQSLTVKFASENIQELLPGKAANIVGTPLRGLISSELAAQLLPAIREASPSARSVERYRWNIDSHEKASFLHLSPDSEIAVIEVMLQDDPVSDVTDRLHRTVDLRALSEIGDLGLLTDQVAVRIRHFTEYDRVMVYRFAEDGSGYVAAEAMRPDLESFLGLHYPASDIPSQARKLFFTNRVRLIEDVGYTPVPIVAHRATPEELDLSNSVLRSVSPIHLRYLANMGVQASLAISLVRDGRLWGMIACHHYTPKYLPPCMLGFTEMLSQVLSVMWDRVTRTDQNEHATKCIDRMDAAMQSITSNADGLAAGVASSLSGIANVVGADGAVFAQHDGGASQYGNVPPPESLSQLIEWLERRDSEDMLVTHKLGAIWPGLAPSDTAPAGLLAFRWSSRSWLLLFRDEVARSVFWAGDPNKAVVRGSDGRLSPRGSFEAWRDDVRGQSLEWQEAEVDALRPLRRLAAIQDFADESSADQRHRNPLLGLPQTPVLVVDLTGTILDWSYAAEKRFGSADLAGRRLASVLPFAPESEIPALLRAAAEGEIWNGEFSNDESAFEVALFPADRADGADQVAVALRDIGEQRRLEELLRHAQKMEAVGQLTGGMAHNFNNLLTVILNSTSLALDQMDAEQPGYAEIGAAQKAGRSAARIVLEMLSFARDEAPVRTTLNVGSLISDVAEVLQHAVGNRVELSADVPSSELLVSVDPNRFEQVLINLVMNARDAIGSGGRVGISAFHEHVESERAAALSLSPGNYVVTRVTDSGAGMPKEILDRIFDPFFSTKTASGGTGLGLSSAFSIIQSFGGAISVRSRSGEGSEFMVYVPEATATEKAQAEPRAAAGSATSAEGRLLIVDDDVGIANLLERYLQRLGYEVVAVRSGRHALALLDDKANASIDLLMTDHRMPDMTGTALIAEVRERYPTLPIVLMSGEPLAPGQSAGQRVEFVQKPFDLIDLQVRLSELLNGAVTRP